MPDPALTRLPAPLITPPKFVTALSLPTERAVPVASRTLPVPTSEPMTGLLVMNETVPALAMRS